MNAVRVELFFPSAAPLVSLPCVHQECQGSTITIIAKDTPLLRGKLIELLLGNPQTSVAVSHCFLGRVDEFQNPHELIHQAFSETAPAPLSFNVKQAAKRLGVSYTRMRELVRFGQIKKARGRNCGGRA